LRKIKLLFIIGTFFPAQAGGPDSSIYWLNKAFLKINNKCECLVLSFFHKLKDEDIKKYNIIPNKICSINGVEVIFFNFFYFRVFNFKFYKFLIQNLRYYSLVHLNSFFFPISLISAILLNIFKVNYCISVRGELEDYAFENNFLKKKLLLNFYKKIYSKSKFFHYTTTKERIKSEKILKKSYRYEIFPNFINKDISKMKKDKNRDRYLYLGRIHPKKNIEKIIAAFKKFYEISRTSKKLYIVGTGTKKYLNNLKSYVKKLGIKDKIIFTGKKNYEAKFEIINRSKFLIFFSKTENFGNVILESLSCKTPVIVGNNLPWGKIKKFKAGFFINNNINTLAKYLVKAEKMKMTEYKIMQKKTQKLIKEFFIEDKINNIFKLYKNNI